MYRPLIAVAAAALIAAAGVAHGVRVDRWGVAPDLNEEAERLTTLPTRIGDWESVEVPLNPRHLAVARLIGHLSREYRHRYTQARVSVVVAFGRPGPVAVHPPEVCYTGVGYAAGPAKRVTLAEADSAWSARFTKPGPNPEALRVCWAWGTGGSWTATDNPRMTFAGAKALYKLYLVRQLGRPDEPLDRDPILDLAKVLIPELRRCISPNL